MRNKISDLNDHLFAELERLGDEELVGADLEDEINRAKAMSGVADRIINNARLALEATELKLEYGINESSLPGMLGEKSNAKLAKPKPKSKS